MAKKQTKKQSKIDDGKVTLFDALDSSLLEQLTQTKQSLQQEAEQQQAAEMERKRQEQKRKEKNKTFEQLLNESDMNWKKYK